MRIGILSDSHDDKRNVRAALRIFAERGITQLIHCGDMTSPSTAELFDGFQVIYVHGNMDRSADEVGQVLARLNPANRSGVSIKTELAGAHLGVVHGHIQAHVDELLQEAELDYLLLGHTHRRRDERHGQTRIINPGALGGVRWQSRSICLLDLAAGEAEFLVLSR